MYKLKLVTLLYYKVLFFFILMPLMEIICFSYLRNRALLEQRLAAIRCSACILNNIFIK